MSNSYIPKRSQTFYYPSSSQGRTMLFEKIMDDLKRFNHLDVHDQIFVVGIVKKKLQEKVNKDE